MVQAIGLFCVKMNKMIIIMLTKIIYPDVNPFTLTAYIMNNTSCLRAD